jgi:hypothetical protein
MGTAGSAAIHLRLERFLAAIPFGQTAPHYFSAGLLGGLHHVYQRAA